MLHRIRLLLFTAFAVSAQAEPITMHGSALLAQVMKAADPFIKEELGIELRVGTEGGGNGGFLSVGSGTTQLGLITKALDAADRAMFPACLFDEAQIGWQVLGIGVARDVWDAGVHSLTRDQMVKIYEGDIRNWKEVGGPDEPIKFYNPKRGRGTWELFATWLYKDQRLAPLGESFETVVRYEDARDSVEFNVGSISVMPPHMADGKSVHILGIKEPDGSITQSTQAMLASKKYPLAKPLIILSGRRFAGESKRLVDFFLSPRGQAIVKSVGFAPVGEAAPASEIQPKPKPDAQLVPPRISLRSETFGAQSAGIFQLSGSLLIGVIVGTMFFIGGVIFLQKWSRLRRRQSPRSSEK